MRPIPGRSRSPAAYSSESRKVIDNPFHVRPDYGIASFLGFQILKVGLAVIEEGFRQNSRAEGVAQEIEAGLLVGISIGPVETHPVAGEVSEGGIAEAGGQPVGRGGSA